METVERFSNRVENYVKYRPGYPPNVLDLFKSELGLTASSVVADIGSGTGLSARQFLEFGCTVFGVEPNDAMRAAAESYLKDFPKFQSVKGTSEKTGLEYASVDLVVAAQAFHWFEPVATRNEFRRIVKPGGWISLIWNERQLESNVFLREYERFLLKYANDYSKVRHENIDEEKLSRFFVDGFRKATFNNSQTFDNKGLMGRVLSASYMPAETDPAFPAMSEELNRLFAKHAENGKIEITYDTNVFYAQV